MIVDVIVSLKYLLPTLVALSPLPPPPQEYVQDQINSINMVSQEDKGYTSLGERLYDAYIIMKMQNLILFVYHEVIFRFLNSALLLPRAYQLDIMIVSI